MASGNKRLVFNSLERAVSTDHNRLQSFLAHDSHEFARHLVSREIGGDFYNFPGMQAPYTALPPSSDFLIPHDCVSGLMVRPDNATGMLVDPGVAAFFVPAFPNATADDSKYIYVSDPGVSSLATLPFVANAGPGVRWDIIECQPTESLLESNSRDIYNPATGQFTNGTVPKVRAGTLTYRIRSGSAGGGIPNPDSAWLPLAAVHVRSDATGYSNCDVYDIRPLVNERCSYSPAHPKALPANTTNNAGFRLVLEEAELTPRNILTSSRALEGYWRGHFGGYWSGGIISRNMPASSAAGFTVVTGAAAPYFDPAEAENQSSTFSIAGDDRFTIGAFFPRGYPRWVRYSESPLTAGVTNHLRKTGRLPNGPRGLLWLTKDAGRANGMILPNTPPTILGETEDAWGHVLCEGCTNSTTDFFPAVGGRASKQFMFMPWSVTRATGVTPTARTKVCSAVNLAVGTTTTNAGNTLTSIDWTLNRTYPIPPYARAIYVSLNVLIVGGTAADEYIPLGGYLSLSNPGVAAPGFTIDFSGQSQFSFMTGNIWNYQGGFWLPLLTSSDFDNDSAGGNGMALSLLIGHNLPPNAVTGILTLEGYQL
jgi:hypothetical protein